MNQQLIKAASNVLFGADVPLSFNKKIDKKKKGILKKGIHAIVNVMIKYIALFLMGINYRFKRPFLVTNFVLNQKNYFLE